MLDCRHELENMEAELKRIQQEVRRRAAASSERGCNSDLVTALQIIQIKARHTQQRSASCQQIQTSELLTERHN